MFCFKKKVSKKRFQKKGFKNVKTPKFFSFFENFSFKKSFCFEFIFLKQKRFFVKKIFLFNKGVFFHFFEKKNVFFKNPSKKTLILENIHSDEKTFIPLKIKRLTPARAARARTVRRETRHTRVAQPSVSKRGVGPVAPLPPPFFPFRRLVPAHGYYHVHAR